MKPSERIYLKYDYLAKKYAAKIFSYEELSYEFDDLVQEFRLKIFTSIKAYGRRWAKYRKGEASRPVHIRFYLEAACGNKMRDFMKYISRENYKVRIDEINYDFGVEDDSQINPDTNTFIVRGIDLLEGLTGKERAIFSLYLRGYKTNFLAKVYYSTKQEKLAKKELKDNDDEPFGPADIIEMQKSYLLQKYGSDLRQGQRVYQSYQMED
jgi:DNA-directed RNA polymerase specialized sigma24 family protein